MIRSIKFSRIVTLCLIFLVSLTMLAADKGKPSIKFEQQTFDFGIIKEKNGPVTHEFQFRNMGNANLIIHSATAECGCTKPTFTENAIAPGKTGTVKVTYNPAGRPGGFTKVITIRCNGNPGKVKLKITGRVTPGK